MNRKEDMVYSIVSPEKNAPSNTDDNTTQPTPDWNTEANVETLAYSDTQITSSDCHSQSKSEETPDVRHAVKSRDWQLLRQLSCHPGGFGKDRVYAWLVVGFFKVLVQQTHEVIIMGGPCQAILVGCRPR